MGLTIALHLLVILISIKPSTPTSTSTSTPTPTSTMSDDDSRSYRTVPIFTLKNPMWFRRFTTHCKENKLGWLMNASTGDDPSDISAFDDLTSAAYNDAGDAEKDRFYNDSLIVAGKLESATFSVPAARSIVQRALQPNGADGVKALKALYEKLGPEAQSAAIQLRFDAPAQRGSERHHLVDIGTHPRG